MTGKRYNPEVWVVMWRNHYDGKLNCRVAPTLEQARLHAERKAALMDSDGATIVSRRVRTRT